MERNFPEAGTVTKKDRIWIGKEFIRIADRYGLTIQTCAEGSELAAYGADCSGCMTVDTFETALHTHLDIPNMKQSRKAGSTGR